jgi:hypothetical protein
VPEPIGRRGEAHDPGNALLMTRSASLTYLCRSVRAHKQFNTGKLLRHLVRRCPRHKRAVWSSPHYALDGVAAAFPALSLEGAMEDEIQTYVVPLWDSFATPTLAYLRIGSPLCIYR